MEIKEFRVIPLSTFPLKSQAAATGTLSMAERSYPTSEVRGRSQKDPMPEGRRPRGVTPRPRSGAAAESARLRWRMNGREELLCVRGRGWGGRPRGATPRPRLGWRPEELPYIWGQGWWPGGATPRPHAWSQGRRPRGAAPHPRSLGCVSAGGPRGAIPRWWSGRVAVRRYHSSKVRSSGCTLLVQL